MGVTYSVRPDDTEFDVPPTIIVGLWRVECEQTPNTYLMNRVCRSTYIPIQHHEALDLHESDSPSEAVQRAKKANQCTVHLPGFSFEAGMILEFKPVRGIPEEQAPIYIDLALYRQDPSHPKIALSKKDCILFDNSKNHTGWYRCDILDQVDLSQNPT